MGALLSSLQNLPPQFVENDRGPLVGAAGSPIRASFHTYKEPKTLSSLLFQGPSFAAYVTIANGIAYSGDSSAKSDDIMLSMRPTT